MIGLTHEEVKELIRNTKDKEKIYDLMEKNYDGYLFSKKSNDRVFNATLVMYFFNNYYRMGEIPENVIDSNVSFNYDKMENCLKLQNKHYYNEMLDILLKNDTINGSLTEKFKLELDFTKDNIISLIYYFGYLTIG